MKLIPYTHSRVKTGKLRNYSALDYIIGTRRSDEQQRIETIVRDSVKIISLADGRGKKPIRIINLSMQTYLREEIRPRGRDTGPPERFHV